MRILIYSMNYHPEPTGIGKYSGEMAAWLAHAGHDVRVVCAPPYYPMWAVSEGYSAKWFSCRVENGVRVYRAPLWVPRQPSGFRRILSLMSFTFSSFPVMCLHALWRPDLVFSVAPSLACAPTALLVAKISGARSWLHVQDFEVDVAFRMGLLKGRLVQRISRWIESKVIQRFDIASSISDTMVRLLEEKQVSKERTRLLANWVDISKISTTSSRNLYRDILRIPAESKVALFSGSLASKQGLMVIPEAAKQLAGRDDIIFVICGDGALKSQIEASCKNLGNVRLLPLQPYEQLNDLLGMADVHILPQSPEAEDLVLPSKLSGMLASGKPIIATCRPNTEIAAIVSRCGLVCPPENANELVNSLYHLFSRPSEELVELGRTARLIAVERFSKESILECFNSEISTFNKVNAELKS